MSRCSRFLSATLTTYMRRPCARGPRVRRLSAAGRMGAADRDPGLLHIWGVFETHAGGGVRPTLRDWAVVFILFAFAAVVVAIGLGITRFGDWMDPRVDILEKGRTDMEHAAFEAERQRCIDRGGTIT